MYDGNPFDRGLDSNTWFRQRHRGSLQHQTLVEFQAQSLDRPLAASLAPWDRFYRRNWARFCYALPTPPSCLWGCLLTRGPSGAWLLARPPPPMDRPTEAEDLCCNMLGPDLCVPSALQISSLLVHPANNFQCTSQNSTKELTLHPSFEPIRFSILPFQSTIVNCGQLLQTLLHVHIQLNTTREIRMRVVLFLKFWRKVLCYRPSDTWWLIS